MSAIPSWARVGAKVVCVRGGFIANEAGFEIVPEAGQIYTVREVIPGGGYDRRGAFLLKEIVNPRAFYRDGWDEIRFAISRFRPLATLEDDMVAHFRALLDTPAPTERERA